jgi:hypothetical protein
MNEQQKKHNK